MVAQAALNAFRARQGRARADLAAGRISEAEAEQQVRPWAAIALLCGVDPAAIHPELPELLAEVDDARLSRWLHADDLCPRAQWVPILAAARDRAFERLAAAPGNGPAFEWARDFRTLCEHLQFDPNGHDIPPWMPASERQAA